MRNINRNILLFIIIICSTAALNCQTDSLRSKLPGGTNHLNFLEQNLNPDRKLEIDSSIVKGIVPKETKQLVSGVKQLSGDSISSKTKEKISSGKKSVKQSIKTIFPTGSIAVGYDYGFLPYTVNMPSPAQAFKTEGQFGLNILNIPIDRKSVV